MAFNFTRPVEGPDLSTFCEQVTDSGEQYGATNMVPARIRRPLSDLATGGLRRRRDSATLLKLVRHQELRRVYPALACMNIELARRCSDVIIDKHPDLLDEWTITWQGTVRAVHENKSFISLLPITDDARKLAGERARITSELDRFAEQAGVVPLQRWSDKPIALTFASMDRGYSLGYQALLPTLEYIETEIESSAPLLATVQAVSVD